jgi:hypothetical protein
MDAVTQRRLPIITADAAFKPGMDSFQQVSTQQNAAPDRENLRPVPGAGHTGRRRDRASRQYLVRDARNVATWFAARGLDTADPDALAGQVTEQAGLA